MPFRPWIFGLLLGVLLGGVQAQPQLSYIGQNQLPTGTRFAGTEVGGLSGIDHDARRQRFVALSDDRGKHGFVRFYELSLDLNAFQRSSTPGSAGLRLRAVHRILDPEQRPFGLDQVDPEALRLAAGGIFWSSEGQRSSAGLQPPTVRFMTRKGRHLRSLPIPEHYLPRGSLAGDQPDDEGVRNNLAFESLALSPDGRTLWTATENALTQDGPIATLSEGSPTRLLAFDLVQGRPAAEHVYLTDPVVLPPAKPDGFATNGLVELLAVDAGHLIAMERSYSAGASTPGTPSTGNSVRLYWVELDGATDVSGQRALRGLRYQPVRKTLLLDLSSLRNDDGSALAVDNLEGLSWGPTHQGRRTLILVSDNNFNASQFTQFIALAVSGP